MGSVRGEVEPPRTDPSASTLTKQKYMQVQIFTLPLMPDAAQTEEINHFLRSHKVIDVRKEVVQIGSVWT